MSLDVNKKSISAVLDHLKKGEWQIPQFQREFVWLQEQVRKLINSFLNSYPIGLITIWDQPQNNPYTAGEKLKLKGETVFGDYEQSPAIIKLVLDGKQRLTTLAMVFGGFSSKDDRYSFSGKWFLNLRAFIKNDEKTIIDYKTKREVNDQQLDSIASCVQKRLIPFKDFEILGNYIAQIHNPGIYPSNAFPSEEERNLMANSLIQLQGVYSKFLIPVAEIPNTITLGDVCEIFDVLNTTGTRVSTFDLIHNLLFKDSSGKFNLRDRFTEHSELNSFSFLCDEDRQEFFCQLVTGCYVLDKNPLGTKGEKKIETIKGPDLINTPLSFYGIIDSNISSIDTYSSDLFSDIFAAELPLKEIPYPASIIIYFSLRWDLQHRGAQFNTQAINKIFRAFFWRNVLNKRYDQGFLSQFSADLKFLRDILSKNNEHWDDPNTWNANINASLDQLFGTEQEIKTLDQIEKMLLDTEIKGALRSGLLIPLKANTKYDFISNESLNWSSVNKNDKVQIHHIFPQKWCSDNEGAHSVIKDLGGPNLIANLSPLTAKSNNEWKSKGPATAVTYLSLNYVNNKRALDSAFIDSNSFQFLQKDEVEKFWRNRANAIAKYIHNLQIVQ